MMVLLEKLPEFTGEEEYIIYNYTFDNVQGKSFLLAFISTFMPFLILLSVLLLLLQI
jgi:hypothetical protein